MQKIGESYDFDKGTEYNQTLFVFDRRGDANPYGKFYKLFVDFQRGAKSFIAGGETPPLREIL